MKPETWLDTVQKQVSEQVKRRSRTPRVERITAAFTAPMLITGKAKVYSIFATQDLFNADVFVKISTDGKLLVAGVLNFAEDSISLSGKVYADLSRITQGEATVLFLADVPDNVRILTLYGKLQMGFREPTATKWPSRAGRTARDAQPRNWRGRAISDAIGLATSTAAASSTSPIPSRWATAG